MPKKGRPPKIRFNDDPCFLFPRLKKPKSAILRMYSPRYILDVMRKKKSLEPGLEPGPITTSTDLYVKFY